MSTLPIESLYTLASFLTHYIHIHSSTRPVRGYVYDLYSFITGRAWTSLDVKTFNDINDLQRF